VDTAVIKRTAASFTCTEATNTVPALGKGTVVGTVGRKRMEGAGFDFLEK
jgi:hypothetical protein